MIKSVKSLLNSKVCRSRSTVEAPASTAQDEPRISWGRHLEFIFTCIGFAVGLGNIWRFPHLTYSNGGGAFLIPYVISLVFMGIPLFCLEILFGQFASLGPIAIWTINPMLKGIGYTMVFLSGVITIYYNIIVAQAFYFFFASMQSILPWTTCDNEWNTCSCRSYEAITNLSDSSLLLTSNNPKCSGVNITKDDLKSPSEEFYFNRVLEKTSGIQEPGIIKWDLTLCNLLAWVVICVSLIKGVKSMGKTVYFFALAPYVLLFAIIIRGVTLEGASTGIRFYLTPDFSVLGGSKVWRDASSQIFFSLSCCTGSLTAMSSYNKFKNNFIRDSTMVPIINCLTSFISGFAVFSVLGFMSVTSGKAIRNVTTSGSGLIFVVYPGALAAMPLPHMWSVLFFLMLICLGLSTQFPSWETVLTAFQDEFKILKNKKNAIYFRIGSCVLGFVLGLPMTTQGGTYLMDLCDIFVAFPLLIVGFLEIVAIVWIYGPRRFREDVLLMIGDYSRSSTFFNYYFYWNFLLVTPLLILGIIIFEAAKYEPITSPEFPPWSETLGWLLVTAIVIWVPVFFIVQFCRQGGFQLLRDLNQHTSAWGPALPRYRTIPRYTRDVSDVQTIGNYEDEPTNVLNSVHPPDQDLKYMLHTLSLVGQTSTGGSGQTRSEGYASSGQTRSEGYASSGQTRSEGYEQSGKWESGTSIM